MGATRWLKWKWLRWLLAAGVVAFLLAPLSLHVYISWNARSNVYFNPLETPEKEAALLLGTAKFMTSGYINPYFRYRINAAVRLWKAGKVRRILVSGDNSTPYYNEPRDMKASLIAAGVPDSVILMDRGGVRTFDSVVRARRVFRLPSVAIISQAFHLERALFIARAQDLPACGFAARNSGDPNSNFRLTIREMYARVLTFLDCYVLGTEPVYADRLPTEDLSGA